MNGSTAPVEADPLSNGTACLSSRGDVTAFLMELCAEIGADNYMLVTVVHEQDSDDARILCSNWIFDAIELVGKPLIARLAQGSLTAAPGTRPLPLVTDGAPDTDGLVTGEETRLLAVMGHAEVYSLRLDVGRQRLFCLLSSARAGGIDTVGVVHAQLKCCYALSLAPHLLTQASMEDPLSDRERECLFWVSEGKTTDEVAVILGVSSNTVNSYIAHAIQKFSAANRAMAIATAIRSSII